MTRFASRHPLVFSILAVLVALVVIKLLDAGLADLELSALGIRLTIEAAFCGYVIFLLGSLWWWREAGFKQSVTWRRLLAYLPLLLVPVLVAASSGFQAAPANQVIGFAILTLMVGFAEESLLRGVVLRALVPGGVLRAVLLSSLFFGLGHLVNIWQGASPFTTIVQVLYSFFLGIGFAGARLYTGTIWPAIVVHALIDFVDIASRGFVLAPPQSLTPGRAIVPIVITGLYALYGWWLLRRTPMPRH
jgi:membrane protease YdiL (CAAX protease family)